MGGLALKKAHTRRYERAEFDIISVELLDIIKKDFKRVAMPLFYKNKKSFGDADIIVSMEGFKGVVRDYITETFNPTEIFHNGNCYSFDYKELQVDLITLTPEHFDSNQMYLSYNDLGNFIGRIAQGFGLKYGQEGLWYEHYYKGMNIARIPISKDYREIFKFLGLSYERWEAGFDELEDIFEYISTCKYFNWEMFQLSRLNKINRERNLKRKSYMSFLEWMEANVADENHLYDFSQKTQEEYNDIIAEAFPDSDMELEIRRHEYEYCKSLYIKAKFNGGDVMRLTGAEGKAIGGILAGFKLSIESEMSATYNSFNDYVIESNRKVIFADFEQYLKTIAINI